MPKPKLSVCLLALNEAKHIASSLKSVKPIAEEIIVFVDDLTTDETAKIAKTFTKNVFIKPHQANFHINKQAAINMAKGDWILWLDADETITPELAQEIKQVLSDAQYDGYYMPRKNIIFDKWIEHTGWFPDYQLRLFRNGKGLYPCEKIHENPKVTGETGYLTHPLMHDNYESLTQFIDKLNRYTSLDAKNLTKEIHTPDVSHFLIRPGDEFVKRFLAEGGYKDGGHGLVLSLLQTMFELVTVAKTWELAQFTLKNGQTDLIASVETYMKQNSKTWKWWKRELQIQKATNPLSRFYWKLVRKLGW